MPKSTVKRCVRPQCMEIYSETAKNRYCMCGALLQVVEIEIKPKKSNYRKPVNPTNKNVEKDYQKKNEVQKSIDDVIKDELPVEDTMPIEEDFFEEENVEEDERHTNAFLYLLLEDDDVEFELSNITRIGRAADGVHVDIDLTEYAGKEVSREHAVIIKEKEGYYLTNLSRNHSVRIMDQDNIDQALEYGKKVLLKSEDGILLSKKILLQFVEEE